MKDSEENNLEQEEKLKEVKKDKNLNKIDKIFREIGEWTICLFVALFIALSIKYFLGTFTTVKQLSMDPTLKQNDRLWLDRTVRTFNKKYEVGDIVTFESPDSNTIEYVNNNNPKAKYTERKSFQSKLVKEFLEIGKISFIKRIIAIEGDHVQIVGGMIFVNGEMLVESYLDSGVTTSSPNLTDFIVPENTFFLVGDNRKNSTDSRAFGCIPIEKMEGKIITRVLPLRARGKIPDTYFEIEKINRDDK